MAISPTKDVRAGRNRLAAALTKGPVEVLDFFLPLWAGTALGASPTAVGVLVALETLVSFLVRPLAGVLADRYDRARLAAVGGVLYGLSFVVYAITPSVGFAFPAAVLGGIGGALFWVALRARVGEGYTTDSGAFSKLFAAEGTGTWIAFVAAMPLAGVIGYRGVFWLAAAACAGAAVVLVASSSGASPVPADAPRVRQLGTRLRPMLLLVALTAAAEAGVALLLLLHLQRGHGLQLNQIAAVFLPGFIVYSTLPEYLHGIVRRLGRTKVLGLALAASAVFAGGLSFAPNPYVIAAMWILSAVAFAAAVPVEQSVVAEAAGVSLGRAMGIYESATLLGATAGTFIAGLVYDAGSWQTVCVGAAVVLVLGALVVRPAIRRVGVAEYPAEAPVSGRAETVEGPAADAPVTPTGPEASGEADPDLPTPGVPASRRGELRNWSIHLAIFLVAQVFFATQGYSWLIAALFGESTGAAWWWNSSGHWMLNLSRIWCYIFVIDTVWSGCAVLVRKKNNPDDR